MKLFPKRANVVERKNTEHVNYLALTPEYESQYSYL